jgi:hypothetical protein
MSAWQNGDDDDSIRCPICDRYTGDYTAIPPEEFPGEGECTFICDECNGDRVAAWDTLAWVLAGPADDSPLYGPAWAPLRVVPLNGYVERGFIALRDKHLPLGPVPEDYAAYIPAGFTVIR